VSVLLAAVVCGASLAALVSTPRSYGWPWDVALVGNYGYGGLRLDAIETTMRKRHDVERWTALAITNSVAVDGEPVVSMIGLGRGSDLHFAVAQGRLPVGDHEIALGKKTAAHHGVGVGDKVELRGDGFAPRRATVTGLAVFPALGPFQAERASPGDGMLLPAAMFNPDVLSGLVTFVGADLADGTERHAALTALRHDYGAWGANGYRVEYTKPVRPAEIVDAGGMWAVPLLVGGLLGVTLMVGLSLAIFVSTRARRRELSILRALGFTGRQLSNSVRVQAVATMLAALAIGVPTGMVTGRLAWRAFASSLAVVEAPSTPSLWILTTVAACLLVAVAAASFPAHVAARTRPALVLRSE
jgi:putative ABC transport system permease protein